MQLYNQKLTDNFEKNVSVLDRLMRVDKSFDLIKRNMEISGHRIVMYYIDGFVKAEMMQKIMMHFVSLKDFGSGKKGDALMFANSSVPTVEVDVSDSVDQLILMVMSGCTVMLCDGFGADAIIIDTRTYPARETQEPDNDRVMRGSRDGFVETLIFNTALIRRRIRDTSLTMEYLNIGKSSRTDIALCYMADKADMEYVNDLRKRLNSIKTDALTLGHQSVAECLIKKRWYNPFPKIRTTERPDAAAATIMEGGVILICDNSPEVMIFPTTLFDFLQETDDYYFPPLTGTYFRIVRHIVFWLTVIVTPLWYLALRNEALLPPWLEFVVPQDPGKLPILAQLLLTEFALDGLKLASLNTPDMLSNSLSVVGGLILGEFAVNVGWLSSDVILYMAFVAIGNFTQSNYELGYAFKYVRIMLLVLVALFNYWGLIIGAVVSFILVATNQTVNGRRNYLYPLIPFNGRAMMRLLFRVKKS